MYGRAVRATALVTGLVAVVTMVCLILFFAVEGPFGTINDFGNGALALLCGVLAVLLDGRSNLAATAAALAGTATAVVGSYLVITETTGYYLAGLVSAFGFGLIGLWLVSVSRSGIGRAPLALVTGVVMAIGLVNIVGIVQGVDDLEDASVLLLAAGLSWAGTYLLLPVWAISFAAVGRTPAGRDRP